MRRGRESRKKRVVKTKIAIVGDGYTEKIYFEQLLKEENVSDVVVKPDIPDKYGGYLKAIKRADFYLNEGYDFVYCLIDLDQVIKNRDTSLIYEETKRLESEGRCRVILCNPCFEIWFLLHYTSASKMFRSYAELEKDLLKHMDKYSKEKAHLEKSNIYKLLKDKLSTNAIPNAIRLERNQIDVSVHHARCQVHFIFQDLFPDDERFNPKKSSK